MVATKRRKHTKQPKVYRELLESDENLKRKIIISLFGTLIILTMPGLVDIPSGGLDPSWRLGLALALTNHLKWGTQYL